MECMPTDNLNTQRRKLTLAQHSDAGDEMFDKGQANIIIDLVSQMIYNLKCLEVVECPKTGHAPEPEHIYKIKKV
jgi:hypothetical protein